MNLYVNGCSHSTGTDVSLPNIEDAYPYLLDEKYGISTVTEAQPGSSNDRIIRSTITHIAKNPHYTHAIIQWSGQDRFESPGHITMDSKTIYDPYGGYAQHYPASALSEQRKHIDIPYRGFYRTFYNQNDLGVKFRGHDKMFTQMLALNSFLESYDITPIHFTFWPFGGGNGNQLRKIVKSQLNFLVDPDEGMERILFSYGYGYNGKQRDDGKGPDYHFNEDAHRQKAEWIYKYLKTGQPVKTPEEVITFKQATDPSYNVYNIEEL